METTWNVNHAGLVATIGTSIILILLNARSNPYLNRMENNLLTLHRQPARFLTHDRHGLLADSFTIELMVPLFLIRYATTSRSMYNPSDSLKYHTSGERRLLDNKGEL